MSLKVEYLGEIKVIFEMALVNESGDQVGSIHEKNQRSKISWDSPFNRIANQQNSLKEPLSIVIIFFYPPQFSLDSTFLKGPV
jgi:hypothetical protein